MVKGSRLIASACILDFKQVFWFDSPTICKFLKFSRKMQTRYKTFQKQNFLLDNVLSHAFKLFVLKFFDFFYNYGRKWNRNINTSFILPCVGCEPREALYPFNPPLPDPLKTPPVFSQWETFFSTRLLTSKKQKSGGVRYFRNETFWFSLLLWLLLVKRPVWWRVARKTPQNFFANAIGTGNTPRCDRRRKWQ